MLFIVLALSCCCEKIKKNELLLYDFESETVFDEINWKCHTLYTLSDMYSVHGKKSLKVEFYPSSYPGFCPALKHHDWTGYRAFCFEVYNPEPEAVELTLRIDDKKEALEYSERYNKPFMIKPGLNTLTIPLDSLKTSITNRPLELQKIFLFLVFMSHPDKKHVLYLDYVRLTPMESF